MAGKGSRTLDLEKVAKFGLLRQGRGKNTEGVGMSVRNLNLRKHFSGELLVVQADSDNRAECTICTQNCRVLYFCLTAEMVAHKVT